ncbi:hypothetical protein [Capnocytophaga canis]|nr:hypothetical protein [Capnocytophaga canis]
MNILVKIYGFVKVVQDVVQVALPILELLISRDLNGDGKIGDDKLKK